MVATNPAIHGRGTAVAARDKPLRALVRFSRSLPLGRFLLPRYTAVVPRRRYRGRSFGRLQLPHFAAASLPRRGYLYRDVHVAVDDLIYRTTTVPITPSVCHDGSRAG